MTDTARDLLAGALQQHQDKQGRLPDHALFHCGGTCDKYLLATPEGQRISEAVALLDAVERLPDGVVLRLDRTLVASEYADPRAWRVSIGPTRQPTGVGYGVTLIAAILVALGAKP